MKTLFNISNFWRFFVLGAAISFFLPLAALANHTKEHSINDLNQQLFNTQRGGQTASQKVRDLAPLLERRKNLMLELAKTDPRTFLNLVLASAQRNVFPLASRSEIEQEQTIEGTLDIFHRDNFVEKTAEQEYFISNNENQKLSFYIAGEGPHLSSGARVRVRGYRLGNALVGTASANTFDVLQNPVIEATGDQRTLFVLLQSGLGEFPLTREQMREYLFNGRVQRYFSEASYGRMRLVGDVTQWHRLSGLDDCQRPEFSTVYPIIRDEVNLRNFDRVVLMIHGCVNGGDSYIGIINHYIAGQSYRFSLARINFGFNREVYNPRADFPWDFTEFVMAHELGHSLGLEHANSWECFSAGTTGDNNCRHQEYGNPFDTMGSRAEASTHYNAFYKAVLGWLNTNEILTIDHTGTYSLQPLESLTGARGARIRTINGRFPYYIEFRRAVGFDSSLNHLRFLQNQEGILINWIRPAERGASGFMTRLLDSTPGYAGNDQNVAAFTSTQFSDRDQGVSIGPVFDVNEGRVSFGVEIQESRPCTLRAPRVPYLQNREIAFPYTNLFTDEGGAIIGYSIDIGFEIINLNSDVCANSRYEIYAENDNGWSARGTSIISAPGTSSLVSIYANLTESFPYGNIQIKAREVGTQNVWTLGSVLVVFPDIVPILTQIDPNTGPVGTRITITGNNFNQQGITLLVSFLDDSGSLLSNEAEIPFSSENPNSISFVVPSRLVDAPLQEGVYLVRMRNRSSQRSNLLTFSLRPHQFSIGDRVLTTDYVYARGTPSVSGLPLTTVPQGTSGVVLEGPRTTASLVWWRIQYDHPYQGGNLIGWTAQNYLQQAFIPRISSITPLAVSPGVVFTINGQGFPNPSTLEVMPPVRISVMPPVRSSNDESIFIPSISNNGTSISLTAPANGVLGGIPLTTGRYGIRVGSIQGTSSPKFITFSSITGPPPPPGLQASPATTGGSSSPLAGSTISSIRVVTTDNLNVRETPDGVLIQRVNTGSSGTIIGGPTNAGSYTWWRVRFDNNLEGWVAGEYISRAPSSSLSATPVSGGTTSPLPQGISPGGLLLEPQQGTIWTVGQPARVRWSVSDIARSTPVHLELIDTRFTGAQGIYAVNIINTGEYAFTLPASLGTLSSGRLGGDNVYKLKITIGEGSTLRSEESGLFSITSSSSPATIPVSPITSGGSATAPTVPVVISLPTSVSNQNASGTPILTSLSPTSITIGTTVTNLSFYGQNFNTDAVVLYRTGSTPEQTLRPTWVSANELRIPFLTLPANFMAGTYEIRIRNGNSVTPSNPLTLLAQQPATGATPPPLLPPTPIPVDTRTTAPPSILQVLQPNLFSVTPNPATAGAAVTFAITGSNFQPGIQIIFGGVAYDVNYATMTQIIYPHNGLNPGSYTFTVRNPGSGESAPLTVNVVSPTSQPPTAEIRVNGSTEPTLTVELGTPLTVTWSSTNASSCAISPYGWTGTTGGQNYPTGLVAGTYTVTLSCSGSGGSVSDSATVTVSAPPPALPPSTPLPTADLKVNNEDNLATITGVPINVTWSSTNASSCAISPYGWTGTTGGQNYPTGLAAGTYTAKLSCSGSGGSVSDSATVTVSAPPPLAPTYEAAPAPEPPSDEKAIYYKVFIAESPALAKILSALKGVIMELQKAIGGYR